MKRSDIIVGEEYAAGTWGSGKHERLSPDRVKVLAEATGEKRVNIPGRFSSVQREFQGFEVEILSGMYKGAIRVMEPRRFFWLWSEQEKTNRSKAEHEREKRERLETQVAAFTSIKGTLDKAGIEYHFFYDQGGKISMYATEFLDFLNSPALKEIV